MTLKEIAARIKQIQAQDPIETLREVLADTNIGEHTIYRPTTRWQNILSSLGLGELESKAVCLTCYSADASIFERVKSALKKKFKAVFSTQVDDLGFRQIFAVADSADKEPQMLICVNYYEDARTSVKAQFSDGDPDNTDGADPDEPLDDEENYFA